MVKVVRFDSTYTIGRTSLLSFKLQCVFARRVGISNTDTDTNVHVQRKTIVTVGASNFTADMNFYTSQSFNVLAPTPLQVIIIPKVTNHPVSE